jgi:hypothetical protein
MKTSKGPCGRSMSVSSPPVPTGRAFDESEDPEREPHDPRTSEKVTHNAIETGTFRVTD